MKEVPRVPDSGQFVVVWEYGGGIWAGVYRRTENALESYSDTEDDFVLDGCTDYPWEEPETCNAKFFIAE